MEGANSSSRSLDTSGGGESSSTIANSNGSGGARQDAKRQQFTNKQRMDMYAFCVLELEMHSNKVSIKKQQQAIQKVLQAEQQQSSKQDQPIVNYSTETNLNNLDDHNHHQNHNHHNHNNTNQQQQQLQQLPANNQASYPVPHHHQQPPPNDPTQPPQTHHLNHNQLQVQVVQQNGESSAGQQLQQHNNDINQLTMLTTKTTTATLNNNCNESSGSMVTGGKTLLQLQQEVAMTRKCYSDYQKTQVLTSSMLREVQKRFAKYYPDSAIPSRSTIKHVFEKCVSHGTVENIKTPRRTTKIPQGDEIEYLLIHEPQLSLRQLAQKLNVSTGTVSRRCKALGLVPESVTIKHQQLATARRQKQIKQLEIQSKAVASSSATATAT